MRSYASGSFSEAEALARDALSIQPRDPQILNLLSVVLRARGKADESLAMAREAAALGASDAIILANLGEMERVAGNLAAAETSLRRALEIDPDLAQAHNNLGVVLFDKREFEKAADSYRRAIAVEPEYAEAHNNLGNALRARDELPEAVAAYRKAIALKSDYAEAHNNLGAALSSRHEFAEAELAYRRALELRPDYVEALNNLANLLVVRKRPGEALPILSKALTLSPDNVATLIASARALMASGDYAQAGLAAKLAVAKCPTDALALCAQADLYQETDRFDEALEAYCAALAIDPNNLHILNKYASCLMLVGRLEDARKCFLAAIERHPRSVELYLNIAGIAHLTKDHPLTRAMQDVLTREGEPEHERFTALHFALGKAHDDAGDYATALRHFSAGARLKRPQFRYDEQACFDLFDRIREVFDERFFADLPFKGNPSTLPVFIVGMPRSGSTLIEQIVASHPQAHGTGEIKLLYESIESVRARSPDLPEYPNLIAAMKPAQFARIARGYLSSVARLAGAAARAVDKLPTNFFHAGSIATLFPNAKIIHTMRNPLDACLSSFTKLYADDEVPYSYDLTELGRFYVKYNDLMQHWRRVLPAGTMLDVRYEQVVANVEAEARKIITFLGLPWDDRCLRFHETNRPVRTVSFAQIRKPIYASSIGRWRAYRAGLEPLIAALGDLAAPAKP